MFALFNVCAYNKETGEIIVDQKAITAKDAQGARDITVLEVGSEKLNGATIVVTPLG